MSANGQVKRINQTIEIVLRCFFVKRYEENWQNILFQIKYVLNVFKNVVTNISFFEFLYDIKSRNSLAAIIRKDVFKIEKKNFENRKYIKLNIIDAMKFAQARMIIQFDKKHKSLDMTTKIYLKITEIDQSDYSISKFSSLIAKKLKSFAIKKKSIFWHMNLIFRFK